MTKIVYIAGPFRGSNHWEIWQNINRASALALQVWRAGAVALCPHMNTFPFQGAMPDNVWLDGDLEILKRCDAVVAIGNWQQSQGARAEVAYARERNIPVFYTYRAYLESDGVDALDALTSEFSDWVRS